MYARRSTLLIVTVLIGWPIVVYLAGPSLLIAAASLLLYGILTWRLRFWAPLIGMLFGGAIALVAICGSIDSRPEAEIGLLFLCMAGGTLLGWFVREMKRLDDSHGCTTTVEPPTNAADRLPDSPAH